MQRTQVTGNQTSGLTAGVAFRRAAKQRCCAARTTSEASTSSSDAEQAATGRRAVLKASRTAAVAVNEVNGRALAEYMALPASQYSVLDANRIERLSDTTFRCYVGGLKFLNFVVEPVLTVSVEVGERGPTVKLLSTKLQGAKLVESINSKFDATMTNVVRWRELPQQDEEAAVGQHAKEITSDTIIQVELEVPQWCSFLPTSSIEGTGSSVLQSVLNTMVPRFLKQLEKDYELWASGDESRVPVGTGEL